MTPSIDNLLVKVSNGVKANSSRHYSDTHSQVIFRDTLLSRGSDLIDNKLAETDSSHERH